MMSRVLGRNTRRLLAHFIAREAIPIGGGIGDGVNFLTNPELLRSGTEKAMANMESALQAVKSAPDNPYGDDDEAIAEAILKRLEERQP